MMNLFCPECGCQEVVAYDDGTCVCQGCGFVGWQHQTIFCDDRRTILRRPSHDVMPALEIFRSDHKIFKKI